MKVATIYGKIRQSHLNIRVIQSNTPLNTFRMY